MHVRKRHANKHTSTRAHAYDGQSVKLVILINTTHASVCLCARACVHHLAHLQRLLEAAELLVLVAKQLDGLEVQHGVVQNRGHARQRRQLLLRFGEDHARVRVCQRRLGEGK